MGLFVKPIVCLVSIFMHKFQNFQLIQKILENILKYREKITIFYGGIRKLLSYLDCEITLMQIFFVRILGVSEAPPTKTLEMKTVAVPSTNELYTSSWCLWTQWSLLRLPEVQTRISILESFQRHQGYSLGVEAILERFGG